MLCGSAQRRRRTWAVALVHSIFYWMERVVDPDLCAAAVADLYSTVFNGPEPVDAAPDSASGILHTLGELRRLSLPQATPEGRRRLQHQRRQGPSRPPPCTGWQLT